MDKFKTPKVSIVIIFLNCEKFIQESIESVFAQTYSNWELLLIDDGSSDNSTLIAKKYVHQYPDKISYLDHPNHQNLGMSASRNLGAQKATGEYLISMDADDVLLPHKLKRQVAIFEANPEIALVYGPTLYWYGWTGKKEDLIRDRMDKIGVATEIVYKPPQLMTYFLSDRSNLPSTCGMMVRKNILETIDGWENDFKNLFEDQVFLAKIVLNYPTYIEGKSGDKYRQHLEMFTAKTTDKEDYYARLTYLKWLSKYITQSGIRNRGLNVALTKALSYYKYPISIIYFIKQIKIVIKKILPNNMFSF